MSAGIVSLVVGTAGHIDHGKSSLVRRLTGIDPDRLAEEQAKGMTIDLGFAPLDLPDGRRVGLIDVPGHERFVKNMVAGATGIDLVILVVAADDGVMPQTREHLDILTLLGLEAGMIAITKIDLPGVDEDLIELLQLELGELVQGTFLEGAPIVALDSLSGRGFDAFRETLIEAITARAAARQARAEGAYRQPIQRVFSAKGFGTVLTGVPLSGRLAAGAAVEVITAQGVLPGRVRGLQAYGRDVSEVEAGHSAAVNVADVDWKAVHRGDTLASPGVFRARTLFEARLRLLPRQRRPLEQRTTVRVHLGTAEVLGEVVLLDAAALAPGEDALCQLRLRTPVVAAAGDRFVVRRHSPMETLGGGTVLAPSRWRLKPFKGFVLERLVAEEEALDDAGRAVVVQLDQRPGPSRANDLVEGVQRPRQEIEALLAALAARGAVVEVSGGKGQPLYLGARGFQAACEQVTDALEAFHAARPLREAMARLELRAATKLTDGVLAAALARLEQDEEVAVRPGGHARAGFEPRWDEPAAELERRLLTRLDAEAFQPPPRADLLAELRPDDLRAPDAEDLTRTLVERGELVAVGDELLLRPARYAEGIERVRSLGAAGPFTASAAREALDTTRRYVIPLLEHFDAAGVTRRQGDTRVVV
ncbi:MAG: selenocysteine-specific translation elongation factor [Planctomycetota bacterium]